MQYDWRRTESLFVVPQIDRVIVVFSLDFNDDTDQAMARVFLSVRINVCARSVQCPQLQSSCSYCVFFPMHCGLSRSLSRHSVL